MFLVAAAILLACSAPAWGTPIYPEKANQLVYDFAGAISQADLSHLESICLELERATSVELAVVVIRSLEGETAAGYANELFERWGIGKKGLDNGLLVLVSIGDRKTWTEVGYGLEHVLTDSKVGRLVDEKLIPFFEQGQYGAGLRAYVGELRAVLVDAKAKGLLDEVPARPKPNPALVMGTVTGGLLVFIGLVLVLSSALAPKCPKCGSRLSVRERVIKPATSLAQGLGVRIWVCIQCGHTREQQFSIAPVIVAKGIGRHMGPFGGGRGGGSGGGFGGFGGGRSGGGGAGRQW
ncbi:MAG: TPM domain-containing protein [Bacillota bacterium]